MLEPRLSAVLNNCPLHAMTPELVVEFRQFAANPDYNNHHNDTYNKLKREFATFYGIEPETFGWAEFSRLVDAFNPHDRQIILGPVLRQVMANKMSGHQAVAMYAMVDGLTEEQFIQSMTGINPNTGRYRSLSPDEVYTYLSRDLGISIEYHPPEGNSRRETAPQAVSLIHMHHRGGLDGAQEGGHWERVAHNDGYTDFALADDAKLNYVTPFLGQDSNTNALGFSLLKQHVRAQHCQTNLAQDTRNDVLELRNIARCVERYLFNIQFVPKPLAIQLVSRRVDGQLKQFIDTYPVIEVPPGQIFERYLTEQHYAPSFSSHERVVAERLREQMLPSSNASVGQDISLASASSDPREKPTDEQQPPKVAGEGKASELSIAPTRTNTDSTTASFSPQQSIDTPIDPPVVVKSSTNEANTSPSQSEQESGSSSIAPVYAIASGSESLDPAVQQVLEHLITPVAQYELTDTPYYVELNRLVGKITELRQRLDRLDMDAYPSTYLHVHTAYITAERLHENLLNTVISYKDKPATKVNKAAFRLECMEHINKARPVLEHDLGWRTFLINLTIFFTTLGFGLLIKGGINYAMGHTFWYAGQSDTSAVVDDVFEKVNQIAPGA